MENNKKSVFKLMINFTSLMFKLEPRILLSFLLVTISSSTLTILMVFAPKIILDGILSNWDYSQFLETILKLGGGIIGLKLFSEISLRLFEKDKSLVTSKLNTNFSKKILDLKYELLEDPTILDLRERAKYPIDQGLIILLLEDLKFTFISIFQLFGLGSILFSFSPWILLFIIFMCLIGGILLKKASVVQERFTNDLMPMNRRYNYYLNGLVQEEFQKEFRLFNLDDVIKEKLLSYMGKIEIRFKELFVEDRNIKILNFLLLAITKLVTYSYAGARAIGFWGSRISLGNFSVVITAGEQFNGSVSTLLDYGISFFRSLRFFGPMLEFYTLEEYINPEIEKDKKIVEEIQTLEFRNVSFSYPKSERLILDSISFTISKGETLALVGRNNAGKSTIIKLIARLFEPTKGEILWNGVNIKKLNLESYLKELAYVFQDFKLFPIKIWENIACYANETSCDTIPPEIDSKVRDVIKRVQLEKSIEKLPNGINTYLNKFLYDDAAEFSGGENQKLAISRAIYKNSSFAILDEPTAALDPLAESEIYEKFSDLVKGKTALFISHRMSASRFCDRILVLDNGKIIGNGHHDDLLKTNFLYQSLYEAQAQYYKN